MFRRSASPGILGWWRSWHPSGLCPRPRTTPATGWRRRPWSPGPEGRHNPSSYVPTAHMCWVRATFWLSTAGGFWPSRPSTSSTGLLSSSSDNSQKGFLEEAVYSLWRARGCSAGTRSGSPSTAQVWPCSKGIQTHPHTRRTRPTKSSRPAGRWCCPQSRYTEALCTLNSAA